STDGGNTKLADYGQTSDASDLLNGGVQGPFDPFNEFYSSSTSQQLSVVDLEQMAVLGYHIKSSWLAAPPTNSFNNGANWNSDSVPTGIAFFGSSNTTTISISSPTAIGGFAFMLGAPAYTFNVTANLNVGATGFRYDSASVPAATINVTGATLTINGGGLGATPIAPMSGGTARLAQIGSSPTARPVECGRTSTAAS